jgi:hypothetical protein
MLKKKTVKLRISQRKMERAILGIKLKDRIKNTNPTQTRLSVIMIMLKVQKERA